ncbi:hypothetical protein DERP_009535 [Dermatophagoides pteronyssinus]|uniref:Coiled-coil domain-containing protein 130 homolog n=1 Tax=Dermatophagoides pteronyssinus TaxID=6956 RepID=A0ABQ8IUQ3_DERPT|nr:hypothetical protein DERP_009535 [Dermatophagoides pteronyssinus]
MAERKATNKYYPPEWNPSKGSINKFRGSHPLRERARKLDQGILIIRFELPFNIWCDGCNNHVGMGVRYNAQKSKVGMYYSTPLYKFRMKCHLCDNHFEIQNDPKNLDYTILNGARRQENRWDPVENEQIDVDKSVSKKIKTDPMFKLENDTIDKKKAIENKNAIENLEQFQSRWKDDYSINCSLRRTFRTKRKELKERATHDVRLLQKSSLPITMNLVTENEQDNRMAKLIGLQSKETPEQQKFRKRKQIMNQSIFGITPKYPAKRSSSSSSMQKPKPNLLGNVIKLRSNDRTASSSASMVPCIVNNYDSSDDD